MKKTPLLSLAILMVAAIAGAADMVTKSSSLGTNPVVYFAGRASPLRLVSLDCTGTNAAHSLAIAAGTTKYSALQSALSTATNIVIAKSSTPVSNDVCLVQTAAGAVTPATVWTNTYSTNKLISFTGLLGTNLAVGDQLRERLTVPYTVQSRAAADATVLFVDSVTGLAGSDILVLNPGGNRMLTNTVASVATANRYRYAINSPVAYPVTIGDHVYALNLTTKAVIAKVTASDGLSLCVATTNGFYEGLLVFIATERGLGAVRTIDTGGVATTNITLTVAAGFATAAGDLVYVLSTDRTATKPAAIGDSSLVLDATTSMALGSNICVNSTGYQPWVSKIAAAPVTESTKSITLNTTFGVEVYPGAVLREASLTALTTTFTADAMDSSVICDVATAIAAGDTVYVFPATAGGVAFERVVNVTPVNYLLSTVTFDAETGGALGVGDAFFLLGTATTFPIGAATVRRDNAIGFWGAGAGVPVRALFTVTNGTLDNLTGFYTP